MTIYEDLLKQDIEFLERRIAYLETIIEKQNRIRRQISSYIIDHRYEKINVFDALDIIYPKVDNNTQPEEPGKGTEE